MKTALLKHPAIRCGISRRTHDPTRVRTILVPTDFSEPAAKALLYACPLAKHFRAAVHLIHVNDMLVEQPMLAPLFSLDTEIGHKLRRRLHNLASECDARIAPAQCHIREGKAFDQICREARLINADLIVMATHGYTGMKHTLIGSTAERVVRHAPCAVLVVRQEGREFVRRENRGKPTLRVARILVPVDFSEYSTLALRHAVAWAKRFGARIALLHALHPRYYSTNEDYRLYDLPLLIDSMRAAAESEMRELVRTTSFGGVPFETHVAIGFPAAEITDFATQNNIDLIVSPTHGRTGLKHVLIGSVAESIVRHSRCAVLVVPTRKPSR